MILGISAGRKGKVTETAVKVVLKETQEPYEFYSLADFKIETCDACLGCKQTHECIKNDGLESIKSKMAEAEAVVFGAPEYWDTMNAKGRAFWERVCFSTRHNEYFPFEGKLGVIIGVSGDGDSSGVISEIETFYEDAKIKVVNQVAVRGEYACFTCGYGHICTVGGLRNFYNLPVEKNKLKKPELCEQYPELEEKSMNVIVNLKEAGRQLAAKLK